MPLASPPAGAPDAALHTLIPLDPDQGVAGHTLGRMPTPDADDLSLDEPVVDEAAVEQAGAPASAEPTTPTATAPATLRPLAGAYSSKGRLGEGGIGVVWLAEQRVLGRDVAIKSVHPRAHKRAARRSLLREAHAAATLEHPNVVPVYDLVQGADGQPGVVMRRIQGEVWTTYLVHPERVSDEFGARDLLAWHLGVLIQVCNAIAFAHSRGVLHRDLKPDNVMIGRFGEVYVLDWGLAVRLDERGPAGLGLARDDHRVVGTPRYMAPEMAAGGGPRLSEKCDIYLLTALLYTLLAGRPPHIGDGVQDTLDRIPGFRPRLPDDTPARLVALVERGLAAEPADRFESAEELRRALSGYLEERGADRIAEQALAQLTALRAELDGPAPSRQLLYRHFGAARFGFQQALAAWPEHAIAQAGRAEALLTMATWELDQGDARAAEVHLAELEPVPEPLVARRAALLAAEEAAAAARRREREEADPTVGQRTRIFVFTVFMGSWTLLPLGLWLGDAALTHESMAAGHAVNLAAVVALVVWARDSLSRTHLNRRVATLMVVVSMALLLGDLGGWALGVTPTTVISYHQLLFAVLGGLAGESVHRAGWALGAVYLCAFATGAWRPELLMPASALANLLVAITAFVQWAPTNHRVLFTRDLDAPPDP